MQRLTYVLFQMDEARRLLEGDRLEQMRLALLLLDNAAELQLERRVKWERRSEDLRERIRERAALIPPSERVESLQELVAWEPLSKTDKRAIDRYYVAKLDYLTGRLGVLDGRLRDVLAYLHRYRNEAYHEGQVRHETLRTASLILFEANCQLLLTVYRVSMYSAAEDYSWVHERFGLPGSSGIGDVSIRGIVETLRSQVVPTVESVVESLAFHLRSRVGDLRDGMDFVVGAMAMADHAEVFKVAQLMDAVERGEVAPDTDAEMYDAPLSLADIEAVSAAVGDVDGATDRLDAFARFSEVELRLEAIERIVFKLVSWADGFLQHQFDLARGK